MNRIDSESVSPAHLLKPSITAVPERDGDCGSDRAVRVVEPPPHRQIRRSSSGGRSGRSYRAARRTEQLEREPTRPGANSRRSGRALRTNGSAAAATDESYPGAGPGLSSISSRPDRDSERRQDFHLRVKLSPSPDCHVYRRGLGLGFGRGF